MSPSENHQKPAQHQPSPAELAAHFSDYVPHAKQLGIHATWAEHGKVELKLPYADFLIGDPERGFIHSSVTTTLIDTACGVAVFCALPKIQRIATLDLRVDYFRPAIAALPLYCIGDCFQMGNQVAFVRATAYQDSVDNPVASGQAAFIMGNSNALNEHSA